MNNKTYPHYYKSKILRDALPNSYFLYDNVINKLVEKHFYTLVVNTSQNQNDLKDIFDSYKNLQLPENYVIVKWYQLENSDLVVWIQPINNKDASLVKFNQSVFLYVDKDGTIL